MRQKLTTVTRGMFGGVKRRLSNLRMLYLLSSMVVVASCSVAQINSQTVETWIKKADITVTFWNSLPKAQTSSGLCLETNNFE